MKVNISISSQCGGERFSCLEKGDLSIIQGGFVLRYDIDGDACELISDKTGISQCRKGNFTYSVKFIPYEKCDFIFTEGGR
ncbi:MAG: hypothetical protein LUI60_04900 [Clostridia bacterium]|nr:hypothetical protein [Clostridia bacterium]